MVFEISTKGNLLLPRPSPIIYECDICGECHPWEWNGDCRDDANRFAPDEYAARLGIDETALDIRTTADRLAADVDYVDVLDPHGDGDPDFRPNREDDMPDDREMFYNFRAEEMP